MARGFSVSVDILRGEDTRGSEQTLVSRECQFR